MKIAVFIYSLAGGGAERVVSQLVPFLEQKGIDVYLVLMSKKSDFFFQTKNKPFYLENSNASENGILKLIKIPILAYRYHLFLKKNGINKSFSFLTRPGFISVVTKFFDSKRKIIISERSNSSYQYGYKNLQSKINSFLIKKLYPKADLIVANSIGNANDLIDNFQVSYSRIKTVYNPINIKDIEKIEPIKEFFDIEFFNLVTIGRLDKGKNHELLIRTIVGITSKKIRLYIFGTGELFEDLNGLIYELNLKDSVYLMGFESNPFPYLKGADLFVFSSNHEGFPNVILEAMACNIPIVSTNCPSGPNEIFETDLPYTSSENKITKYGILVPRNNASKMREAILYMMENKIYYNRCKEKLNKRIYDFEKEKVLEKFYTILKS